MCGRLVERHWELNAIEQSLQAADHGVGSVLYVEGPTGIGKSALLGAAAELADDAGAEVLAAEATELEQEFPFGIALQLLEPTWHEADPRDRESLLLGAAGRAARLLSAEPLDGADVGSDDPYRLIHALYWVTRNLISLRRVGQRTGTLLLLADDVQWADGPSARFLAYLGQRIADLPVVLAVAATAGERPAARRALAALRGGPRAVVLAPEPLGPAGIDELTLRRLPDADPELGPAIADATGGNPYLVEALLTEVRALESPDSDAADQIADVVPAPVVDRARRQLERLPAAARAVALAAAMLGADATIATVAEVAAVKRSQLATIADALTEIGLLRGGAGFVYARPLVRSAVLAALADTERADHHARTAVALAEHGRPTATVAAHLLASAPGLHPRVPELLRQHAADALAAGDASTAAALLRRALREQPGAEARAALLIDLHIAEAGSGEAGADGCLAEAGRLTTDPVRRAQIALLEAKSLYAEGRYARAAEVADRGIGGLNGSDPELKRQLTVAYVTAASLVPALQPEAIALRDQTLGPSTKAASPAECVALAHTILRDALAHRPRAEIRDLGRTAWADGALLRAVPAGSPTLPTLLAGLLVADELDLVDEVIAQACGAAAGATAWIEAAIRPMRGWSLYLRGRVADAEIEARASHDLDPRDWPAQRAVALALIASCHINRDQLELADDAVETLAGHAVLVPAQKVLRAHLSLAHHRPEEALSAALEAGAAFDQDFPGANPTALPWRTTAATAQLALGRDDEARALADVELTAARELNAVTPLIRALRTMGLTVGGADGLALLQEAVAIGECTGPRIEHVRALVDYGAALRRGNQRSAAREPLRRGLDLSNAGGIRRLAATAHAELMAAGARPRRLAFSGVDSLTISQRRVAELAARGLTTARSPSRCS